MKSILIAFILIGCSTPDKNYYSPIEIDYNDYRSGILIGINAVRLSNNCGVLKPEQKLTELAENHTIYMSENQEISHAYFYDRQVQSQAVRFSEICGYGHTNIVGGFTSSPAHLAKIINSEYTHIGISSINGFTCINFGKYK